MFVLLLLCCVFVLTLFPLSQCNFQKVLARLKHYTGSGSQLSLALRDFRAVRRST